MANSNLEYFTGYVADLYKGCPKSSGWNGWHFVLDDGTRMRCTMKHGNWIHGNMYLTIAGRTVFDKGFESFEVEHAEIARSKKALMAYLTSSDFPGIGRTTVTKLYDAFGANILDIIDLEPDKLKTVGISDKQIQLLKEGRLRHSIGNLLQLLDLKPAMIDKIRDKYGDAALQHIKKNPYVLLKDFKGERGFNFTNVDKVALACGVSENDPIRINEAVYYAIDSWLNAGGHICALLNDTSWFSRLRRDVLASLGTVNVTDSMLMDAMKKHDDLVLTKYHVNGMDLSLCYTKDSYAYEQSVANRIGSLLNSPPLFNLTRDEIMMEIDDYEMMSGVELDAIQRESVVTTLRNRLSIITGGPGCGKTTVVACVLFIWRRTGRPKPVLSAPTGLAAKRLKNSIVGNCSGYMDDMIEVKTIARRLTESACDNKGHAYNPTLAVIDETSMVNLADMSFLLKLLRSCQVVFVGDADQLPSIDPGDFFANLCALDCVPKTVLNICYRAVSAQMVIGNSHKIRDGVPLEQLMWLRNTFWFQQFLTDSQDCVEYLVERYLQYIRRGYDYSDVAILSPTKKYQMGSGHLNIILQNRLNPEVVPVYKRQLGEKFCDTKGCPIDKSEYYVSTTKEKTALRIGDRVMYSKNRYDIGLVNGDCGIITGYHVPDHSDPYLDVKLDTGKVVEVNEEYFGELHLAYAMTIHKAQGCEYQHVLISSPDLLADRCSYQSSDNGFATRNILYTAATRAKMSVEFVGSRQFADICIANQRPPRLTLLPYRILEQI